MRYHQNNACVRRCVKVSAPTFYLRKLPQCRTRTRLLKEVQRKEGSGIHLTQVKQQQQYTTVF